MYDPHDYAAFVRDLVRNKREALDFAASKAGPRLHELSVYRGDKYA